MTWGKLTQERKTKKSAAFTSKLFSSFTKSNQYSKIAPKLNGKAWVYIFKCDHFKLDFKLYQPVRLW